MEKSPLTWDYLESGFAREVSGTCQPKHWEADALPLGDARLQELILPHSAEKNGGTSGVHQQAEADSLAGCRQRAVSLSLFGEWCPSPGAKTNTQRLSERTG